MKPATCVPVLLAWLVLGCGEPESDSGEGESRKAPDLTGPGSAEPETPGRDPGQNEPDLDDPEVLAKILEEALPRERLEEKGPEGAKLFYALNRETPFTGWTKRVHGNGHPSTLAHCDAGRPSGPAFKWRENGQMELQLTYKSGLQDGPYTKWHDNGEEAESGIYRAGKLEGLVTTWYANGQKEAEFTHRGGLRDGPYARWYADAKEAEKGTYRNGKLEGLATVWHDNGQKKKEVSYQQGKKEGLETAWHPNGQKKGESAYRDGKLEGPSIVWDPEGKVLARRVFKNGQPFHEDDPDFDDPEVLAGLMAKAVPWESLERREGIGETLYVLAGAGVPYTGFAKKLHDNGQVALLGSFEDGQPRGPWTWWDAKGEKEDEKRY